MFAENAYAFLTYAIAPYHPHHLLVIPKRHFTAFLDITEDERAAIDALIEGGWRALTRLGYENITVLVREGKDSGKSIAHLHYHIIPNIRIGDVDHLGIDREVLSSEDIARVVADVSAAL